MLNCKIVNIGNKYYTWIEGRLTYKTVRKNAYIWDKILFYSESNDLILQAFQWEFIPFFTTGYKVRFVDDNNIYRTAYSFKKHSFSILYDGVLYSMKFGWFKRHPHLHENEEITGTIKILKSGVGHFEHALSCKSHTACLLFSLLDIIQDND